MLTISGAESALRRSPALSRERTARADTPSRARDVLYEGLAKRRVRFRRSGLASAGPVARSVRSTRERTSPGQHGSPREFTSAARQGHLQECSARSATR